MSARLYTFAAAAAVAGLLFLWLALQLPGGAEVTTLIGPRTWPLLILSIMLALVVVMVAVLAFRGPASFEDEDESDTVPDDPTANATDEAVVRTHKDGRTFRHVGLLAVTVAYTVLMGIVGYVIATALFAAAATATLGERRPLRILLTTAIAVVVVAVVFDRLLNIPLP